ncbi:hypothetical protein A0J48_002835 [Sphaerospermopsis aphanizomenoides BCCUSP55]|nr:hypothetical protein [Sphaerospermopsis aphanizomenoides]MBK1986491.1 hypothetical protein [Sphaerospermopsis aphanizomenoides BCCUSP55]
MNEPRRDEGHEGKKVLERFCSGQVYFFKIGMIPKSSPVLSELIMTNKLKIVGGYDDLDTGKVSLVS